MATKQKAEVPDFEKNQDFKEIEVRRITTRSTDDEGRNVQVVSFEKLKDLRPRVVVSQKEVNALNRGKMHHASNEIFTLLVPANSEEDFKKWTITFTEGKNPVYSWPSDIWE